MRLYCSRLKVVTVAGLERFGVPAKFSQWKFVIEVED
jgi:hypothetical protein